MKTHLIFSYCLLAFLSVTLFNCKTTDAPQPRVTPADVFNPFYNSSNSVPNELENLTVDFVRASSTLLATGNNKITQYGHVWSSDDTNPNYNENSQSVNSQTQLGALNGNESFPFKFVSYAKGLNPGTTYTIRPYVKTDVGTFYGPVSTFKTLDKVPN